MLYECLQEADLVFRPPTLDAAEMVCKNNVFIRRVADMDNEPDYTFMSAGGCLACKLISHSPTFEFVVKRQKPETTWIKTNID